MLFNVISLRLHRACYLEQSRGFANVNDMNECDSEIFTKVVNHRLTTKYCRSVAKWYLLYICRPPVFTAQVALNVRALSSFQRVLHNLLYFRSIGSDQQSVCRWD